MSLKMYIWSAKYSEKVCFTSKTFCGVEHLRVIFGRVSVILGMFYCPSPVHVYFECGTRVVFVGFHE